MELENVFEWMNWKFFGNILELSIGFLYALKCFVDYLKNCNTFVLGTIILL